MTNLIRNFSFWFWLIPLVLSGFLYTVNLSRLPLQDADEATYAMVVREMTENHHYGTLTLFNKPWLEKPPLLFWMMAASASVFGLNEFALRFPVALTGIIAVAFVIGILWEATRRRSTVFLGGMIVTLFPLFLAAVRNVRMDVPVTAAVLAALYFFMKGRRKPVYFLGVGIAIAVGILFKSVIALLAVPVVIIFALVYRNWRWLKSLYLWLGALLGFVIALPWHIYEIKILGPIFLNKYLGLHVLGRATENIIQSHIGNSYVLAVFWKYGQPWSLVFLLCLPLLWLIYKKRGDFLFAFFSLLSFIFVFGIFMLVKTRLITYFIPAYPFLAMFIAAVYGGISTTAGRQGRYLLQAAAGIAVLIAAILSFNEAFFHSHLYIAPETGDSKQIGLDILKEPATLPVYIYEYQSDQTIQYYSQRQASHLTEETAGQLQPPFLLIIPSDLVGQNQWLNSFKQPYKGKFLTLTEIF